MRVSWTIRGLAAALVTALMPVTLVAQRGGGSHAQAMHAAPVYRAQPRGAYRPQGPSGYRAPASGYRGQPYGQPGMAMRPQQGYPAPQAGMQPAAPIERRSAPLPQVSAAAPGNAPPNLQFRGNHLNEWMNAHSNLPLAQQHAALDREPGFRELPPETQQRLHERLSELNAMPPQQRQRMIANTEAMERLSPAQRAEVRSSMLELGSLPPPQRSVVQHAFRELRGLPPQDRLNLLNSRYRDLDPQSRVTLEHLMQVEPLLPER